MDDLMFATKLTDTIQALAKVSKETADTMRTIVEKMYNLDNRQDVLWKAIQGLLGAMNKQAEKIEQLEQAIINMGKEIK